MRGVFNRSQTPEQVLILAETAAFVFGRGTYGVGWDGRKSSAALARAVSAGLAAAGSNTVLFGLVPTPVTAYGARKLRCPLGFSVTASHNPPEFSGVKIFNSSGMELSKGEEARIERGMMVDSVKSTSTVGSLASSEEIIESYIADILTRFEQTKRSFRVVVDCANGPGGSVTPRILMNLGHKVLPLNAQISWRFPGRMPEPTRENLKDTAAAVAACGADFGFAHDGDADRLVMINSVGEIVPDAVVSIIALRALQERPGAVIILSENTSAAVEEVAKNLGFRVVRSRVGKTYAEIDKESAVFASEPSKVVDPKWGMWEDGMYCAAVIVDALAKDPSLFAMVNNNNNSALGWHYRQVNLPLAVDFDKLVAATAGVFGGFRVAETRRLDGLKLVFKDDAWIMFRSSGTEQKTRIYSESKDLDNLEELLQAGRRLVEQSSKTGEKGRW